MTGPDLAGRIADRLRTHQWYDNPRFPILHAPSAHGTHEDGYTSDCAICRRQIDRIAAVAAQVAAEHYTPEDGRQAAADIRERIRFVRGVLAGAELATITEGRLLGLEEAAGIAEARP